MNTSGVLGVHLMKTWHLDLQPILRIQLTFFFSMIFLNKYFHPPKLGNKTAPSVQKHQRFFAPGRFFFSTQERDLILMLLRRAVASVSRLNGCDLAVF